MLWILDIKLDIKKIKSTKNISSSKKALKKQKNFNDLTVITQIGINSIIVFQKSILKKNVFHCWVISLSEEKHTLILHHFFFMGDLSFFTFWIESLRRNDDHKRYKNQIRGIS